MAPSAPQKLGHGACWHWQQAAAAGNGRGCGDACGREPALRAEATSIDAKVLSAHELGDGAPATRVRMGSVATGAGHAAQRGTAPRQARRVWPCVGGDGAGRDSCVALGVSVWARTGAVSWSPCAELVALEHVSGALVLRRCPHYVPALPYPCSGPVVGARSQHPRQPHLN